ncbi:hypothetical protein [Leptospira bouyouniensis]|uniref:hypothetical protein n=1 Tax=Leptospira bouyouniensis TaxID=2484911 RepID=UPI0010915B03|nr:hypothetical protein [Leptospira bouyouniensis]TGM82523.1 hypothetical protein EHQ99_06440 [Leptospira bouyouniensis]
MKNLIKVTFICLISISCTSSNELKLNFDLNSESTERYQIISIKFHNFQNFKNRIIIKLQKIEYTSDENFQFGSNYTYNERIENELIEVRIPNGKYVGTIELIYSKTTPFYKGYFGISTIYFGINENMEKIQFQKAKCYPKKSYGYRFFNSLQYSIFCSDLNISDKNYTLLYTKNNDTTLNEPRTLWLTYLGISSGFAKTFVYYPYAPMLMMSGYFGFLQNDIDIEAEFLEP